MTNDYRAASILGDIYSLAILFLAIYSLYYFPTWFPALWSVKLCLFISTPFLTCYLVNDLMKNLK